MILIFTLDTARKRGSNRKRRISPHKFKTPTVVTMEFEPDDTKPWRGIEVNRYTAFDMATTPPTLLRRDYALDDLRKLGALIPPLYIDERGNIRNETDSIVMAGPSNLGKL